jgi:nucleotide-binding universal stress UspA family protein
MYKNILVAVDQTETSTLALNEALRFHKAFPESFLRIITVVDENITNYETISFQSSELQNAIKNEGLALLKKIESNLQAQNISNFEIKLIELSQVNKSLHNKISEEAELWPADLIIMGTHGRQGLSHLFLGSVAEGVIRDTSIPLLLIRGKATS